jgi:BirA family biotin operon repressor/biotin-[acetyl-CoA-carboxylase] ligase
MYKILANTIFLGKDVHFLPECHSTNDTALMLVKKNMVREGSIVICDHQTEGKGQRGNHWQSGYKLNLTFSLILEPDFMDISEQFYLNMCISNSLRKILSDYLPDLKVKWPNDLLVPNYGKIGGILIENTLSRNEWDFAVVGIGLNINQVIFDSYLASSLKKITGSDFDLEEIFRLVVTHLEQGYIQLKKGKWREIQQEYLHHLFQMDTWAEYRIGIEQITAKIVGISNEGKLRLLFEDGSIDSYGLKEISFLY